MTAFLIADLLHHLFVDGKTAGGVDDHQIKMVCFGVADSVFCNLYRILVAILCIDGNIDLVGEHFQLVNSCGTIDVACHKERTFSLL